MKFITESGSCYEVNTDSKKIRRLKGQADPTPRMGKDGEWRPYADMLPDPVKVGSNVLIIWGSDVELMPETKAAIEAGDIGIAMSNTMTSCVVKVEP